MKTTIFILSFIVLSFQTGKAQTKVTSHGPLISGTAPSFKGISTQGDINFPDDYFGKWKILFSHPADFTPVCTSEIMALAKMQNEFKKLNTALIVISTDGINSHMEWVRLIDSITYDSSGVTHVDIEFPLITDADLSISKLYGLVQPDSTSKKDIRGVYFIDPDNKIRAFFFYPFAVGRNMQEIKRTLIALQTEDKHDCLMPANWQPGGEVLLKSPKTVKEAEKLEALKSPALRKVTWYMWYKKL